MSSAALTDEQINSLTREQLQDALQERDLPATGSNAVLRQRLREWSESQRVVAAEPATPEVPEADNSIVADQETPDQSADQENSDADSSATDADEQTPDSPTAPDTAADTGSAGGKQHAYSSPGEEATEPVTAPTEDLPASSYREACQSATLVRVVGSPIVQVFPVPFSPRAKQLVYQRLGLLVRSFVNEELEVAESEEPTPAE